MLHFDSIFFYLNKYIYFSTSLQYFQTQYNLEVAILEHSIVFYVVDDNECKHVLAHYSTVLLIVHCSNMILLVPKWQLTLHYVIVQKKICNFFI